MRYQDRVVIVTGGTKSIGLGCARVFVEAGARVVICARGEQPGPALAAELSERGPGSAVFERCDVSKVEQVERLIDAAVERFGQLDCLINNAGWHPPAKTIDEFSCQDFRDGNIINMSSLVGAMGQLHATTYVATKGAVTAFSKALAVDEAAHDVRVNSVSPGNVYTPLWQEAIDAAPDPERCRADGDAAQPLGRMGTLEEAGRLCLFIAAEATFTTGVDHILSGGAELAYGRKSRKS